MHMHAHICVLYKKDLPLCPAYSAVCYMHAYSVCVCVDGSFDT